MKRLMAMSLCLGSMVACATTSQTVSTQSSEAKRTSGLVIEYFDHSVRPQDDLYRFANGTWLDTFTIPADKSRYGAFTKLYDEAQENLRRIILDVSSNKAEASADERKVGAGYHAFMDEKHIEELGLKPLDQERAKIAKIESAADFAEHMGHLSQLGVRTMVGGWIDQDAKNTTEYIIFLSQSGLGLPDRDYYFKEGEKFETLRSAYVTYLKGLFEQAGRDDAADAAARLMAFETAVAETQWQRVKNRNRDLTYNKFDEAGLAELASEFAWQRLFLGMGLESVPSVVVRQPDYMTKSSEIFAKTPVAVLRDYLEARLLSSYAPRLHRAMVELHFGFYGKVLRGAREMEPRWKRGVGEVERNLGEVLGKIYVSRHFKPEAKERMVGLVDNLEKAFGEGIDSLEWMTDSTKEQAQEKLGTFVSKIGYPDRWREYDGLEVSGADVVGNAMRARKFEHARELGKLGKAIDRDEWFMNPQTVNAYYNPSMNEIVFPAAILQPPFFNLSADDAVNYGSIGAVIGHELSHGFDDQGRKSDGRGMLRDWWTDADAKEFEERAGKMVEQYKKFSPVEGMNVNGKLTLGENIGDLGGLTIAYRAYKLSLGGQEAQVIDGLTGEQRFFLGWAQMWACKYRESELRQRLMTDPHAPTEYRVTGVVSNMPEFYEAFDVKEGDKLYRNDTERVKIW